MTLRERIQQHEGTGPMKQGRFFPYVDAVGKVTIGWGYNLTDNGLPRHIADLLLDEALSEAYANAASFPWVAKLDPIRREVVVELIYNMGLPTFKTFKATIAALEIGDYARAAGQLRDSKWAGQVGTRAIELITMMATGLPVTGANR